MLPILRKFLNSCHVTSKMKLVKLLSDADSKYCLRRAQEAIIEITLGVNVEDNYKLAIQLINMAHYKKMLEEETTNLNEDIEANSFPKA